MAKRQRDVPVLFWVSAEGIEAEDNIIKYVETEVEKNRLVIAVNRDRKQTFIGRIIHYGFSFSSIQHI